MSGLQSNLQTFSDPKFGTIRTITIDGDIWLVGKDVAKILGYINPQKAIRDHVDNEDKLTERIVLSGQNRKTILINESGLYSLILSSKLESAKQFKHWITREVIPSIRKHGTYMTPEKLKDVLLNPDTIIEIAKALKAEQEKNKELAAVNQALTKAENEWDDKNILNALIRAYSKRCHNGNYANAWTDFYKQLRYAHHIDLNIRSGRDKHKRQKIDLLRPNELKKAVSLAAAICESNGMNTGKIINEINLFSIQCY